MLLGVSGMLQLVLDAICDAVPGIDDDPVVALSIRQMLVEAHLVLQYGLVNLLGFVKLLVLEKKTVGLQEHFLQVFLIFNSLHI